MSPGRGGRLVQCCTCPKWVHFRRSLFSLCRFETLGSSHSCICLPVSSGGPTPTTSLTPPPTCIPLLFNLAHLHPFVNAALLPHPHLQTSYPPSTYFISPLSASSPPLHMSGCFPILSTSSPDSFRIL